MQPSPTTKKALLALTAHAFLGRECAVPPQTDWQELIREAEEQTVLPCLLSCGELPEPVRRGELRTAADHLLTNNLRVYYSHGELHRLMTESGIPYVILKGCASASYYPDPMVRTMGDVDFLIAPEYLDKADRVLREAGFTHLDDHHDMHTVYTRGEEHLELHFSATRFPEGPAEEVLRSLLADVVERRELREVSGFEMYLPSDFHHGLIILLHAVRHLFSSGLGLRHLCDWAVFVEGLSDEAFCAMFEGPFREAGLWRTAQLLTLVCVRYLGCTPREWTGTAPDTLLEGILSDIFRGGNFGIKNPAYRQASLFLSMEGRSGAGWRGRLGQLIRSMNRMIRNRWPIAKRFPFLLPLGWLFWGLRFEIRVLLGKREQLHPVGIAAEVERRSAVYREFYLYER